MSRAAAFQGPVLVLSGAVGILRAAVGIVGAVGIVAGPIIAGLSMASFHLVKSHSTRKPRAKAKSNSNPSASPALRPGQSGRVRPQPRSFLSIPESRDAAQRYRRSLTDGAGAPHQFYFTRAAYTGYYRFRDYRSWSVDFPKADGDIKDFALLVEVVRKNGPQALSGLKDQLRKRQGDFNERRLGYSGFLRYVQAAAARGMVNLQWDDSSGDYLVSVAD